MPSRAKRHGKQAKATGTGANQGNHPAELGEDHGKQNDVKIIFLYNFN